MSKIDGEIYLSLDIDVLDPDDAPGTYYKEWCGLRIDELVELVKVVKEKGESLKAVDICEYYKPKDEEDIT